MLCSTSCAGFHQIRWPNRLPALAVLSKTKNLSSRSLIRWTSRSRLKLTLLQASSSWNTSIIGMGTPTARPSPTLTSLHPPTPPSSPQRLCWLSSRKRTRSLQPMCNCTTTLPSHQYTSTIRTRKDSTPVSWSKRNSIMRRTSKRAAGMLSILLPAIFRPPLKPLIACSQQWWLLLRRMISRWVRWASQEAVLVLQART